MKCTNCGADLAEGVLFCRECGAKVETALQKKRFCRECGAEIPAGAKFCIECGARLTFIDSTQVTPNSENAQNTIKRPSPVKPAIPAAPIRDFQKGSSSTKGNNPKISDTSRSSDEVIKSKVKRVWNKLDLFIRITVIASAVIAVFLLIAILAKNTYGIVFGVIQLCGLVVSILMHKGTIKLAKDWLKWLVMGLSVLLIVLNITSYSWGKTKKAVVANEPKVSVATSTEKPAAPATNYTIQKGTQYAYMSDEANVYIANAISDSIITVECWGRNLLTEKSVKHDYDIGTFKINDPAIGFSWIDEKQTAFSFLLQDTKNSNIKKQQSVIFTINVSDSDEFKGTDYHEDIACYLYRNDDWNIYRAVRLTDTLVKIENWGRSSSGKVFPFIYNYDLYIIDENNTDTDFEWTDQERTSFTISLKDLQNDYYLKEPKFVAFTLENSNYTYEDVYSYLNDIPRKDAVPSANSTETVPQVDNAANESSCQLYIEVDFVENYFFSKYNAELYLDDQYVATLSHGKYYTTTLNVSPGRHKLSFKEENGSNRGSAEFTVKKDSTFTCKIETTSSGIDVSNKNLTEFLTDAKVIMPDTVGMLYSEALEALKQAGLSNISYETVGNHFIWVDSNWLVQGQNIEAGTSVPKSEDVKLECISLEDYFKETYVGKNVAEIQKLAEEKGFTIIFQDKSDKSLDDMIESMDSKTKEDWVATSARQYTFTGSTAVVTVEFVGIPTPTPIPTNTPVPTASETSSSQAVGSTPKATSTPKTTQNPSSASYHSSNDRDVAKKGNTGVYAYKLSGRNYDQYCIIDFDKGYVYFFNHGNGDGSCARVKIASGDLNGYVLITWHDGGTTWQYALRFNYKNMPDTMIVEDNDHYEYKYSETNLNNALQLRNKLKITDY